jgi:NTP pyrophosphatase (non-canonical NTP hydrolase)
MLNTEYEQMVKALFKSGEKMKEEFLVDDFELLHSAMGICTEAGEIYEIISGAIEYDKNHLVEELGDLDFYLTSLVLNSKFSSLEFENAGLEVVEEEFPLDGLILSAAQILDLVKKITVYRKTVEELEFFPLIIKIDRYIDSQAIVLGMTREDIREENKRKLQKRYDQLTYSNDAAIARKDKE